MIKDRKIWYQNILIVVFLLLALSVLGLGGNYIHQQSSRFNKDVLHKSTAVPNVLYRGVYVWQSPDAYDRDQQSSDLKLLKSKGYNTVYLNISNYLDYSQLPNPAKKQTALNNFKSSLKNYVSQATSYGISVHALAGVPGWGLPNQSYAQTKLLSFVRHYNQSASTAEQLRGLQFDIETYNDPSFNTRKSQDLITYLNSVKQTVKSYISQKDDFALGYTLPYWFDNENGNIPSVNFSGKKSPTAYHVFDTLSAIKNSYVVLLDYRNQVDGTDGSAAHAQNEIVYTSVYTPQVKLIIGQETTKQTPAKISFYSHEQEKLLMSLQKLAATFQSQASFNGFAINDIVGLKDIYNR